MFGHPVCGNQVIPTAVLHTFVHYIFTHHHRGRGTRYCLDWSDLQWDLFCCSLEKKTAMVLNHPIRRQLPCVPRMLPLSPKEGRLAGGRWKTPGAPNRGGMKFGHHGGKKLASFDLILFFLALLGLKWENHCAKFLP